VLDRPKPTKRELRRTSDRELLRLWRDESWSAAREVLVERYQPLVRSLAGKFRARPHDFEDHVQAGNLWGLLPAIDKCESSRALSSYARAAIYRAIRDYKNETDGPIYRPLDSENSFKYRWAKLPAQKAMLLASEANRFTDPLSADYKPMPDWSFDYPYEFEDDNGEFIEAFDAEKSCDTQTFDRQGHTERIKLDHALETLDARSRHIIEQRWLINECFDHIGDYIESGLNERTSVQQEELATFFGVCRQRVGQLENAAIAKLKVGCSGSAHFPEYAPHFVTQRWNSLLVNRFVLCGPDEYPISPSLLKCAPRPSLDSGDTLARLCGLLIDPPIFRPRSKPAIYVHGWRWFKPTISDGGWRHNAADVWNPIPDGAYTDPKRNPWPYPRPELSRVAHIRIAYLHPWNSRLDLLALRSMGDTAKIWRIIRWERGRIAPDKPGKRWGYISPEGHLIPVDKWWPRPWRFPGWYPRPRKSPKTQLIFRRKHREWIPFIDENAPEHRGDDGSLMTDPLDKTLSSPRARARMQ